MPGYGVFARHVRGLELANINLSLEKADKRPAIVCADVDGLEIDNFKAQPSVTETVTRTVFRNGLRTRETVTQPGEGARTARFENVTGLVVRNAPVLKGVNATAAK
jgi:hypothetical protein